ncbi:MAG: protease modulator HflC [Piscirickettsiaceae bacterium CG_4_9_14_3_um_filter_43_564]|nr:protease modulator HflC [Thiomicrospira sp.]OIP96061.1 MAG: HflC protein [Thiomicrospira sp. CG2_30_44_34]PIQ03112.1 MAG: HflC protein [Piscirickettsiaceae bacterium CG18_big_fil_WC_8_21_14_2_50_44_103]PIU39617.1 MAG: protease modulator HflC [Piscirickettsiaceae bacterium CG07_land_8_20_14_0_80_44_28]PIW57155.1 MAG: protease modulator HflC [Piscirickettsiaceae bacterium CG12_big_fil_rev_8_21_14_0_65_44_934]PIW77311.1 MAG: protease modulator HflC [Piscirickettsiaceae bacterium CG_4_8_14_3_um
MKAVLSILVAALLLLGGNALFTIQQGETGVVFRFGEIVKTDLEPGLHFKMPFVNNVRKFDARLQTLDSSAERYLTSEKKNLLVDSFVEWRIRDTKKFYTSMNGDIRLANLRLAQIIKDGLRSEVGNRTVQEVISQDRKVIVNKIIEQTRVSVSDFGIDVVDIKVKRVDLPQNVSESVYQRMEAERNRVAKDLRSQGAEAAERIRADADRQRTIIIADAYRDAEIVRGEGDAKSAEIYANAYSKDSEFYSFYQSLNAYQESFNNKSDMMIVDPKSDFFKFFNQKNK